MSKNYTKQKFSKVLSENIAKSEKKTLHTFLQAEGVHKVPTESWQQEGTKTQKSQESHKKSKFFKNIWKLEKRDPRNWWLEDACKVLTKSSDWL